MKLRLLTAATVAALTLGAGAAVAQDTSSERGRLSYAIGYDLGRNLIESGEAIDINTVIRALQDGYGRKDPTVPVEQLRQAVGAMEQRQMAKAQAAFNEAATQNKTRSDQFLAQNRSAAGVQVLPNGVQYKVIEAGSGRRPTQTSKVDLEVTGPFPWGQRPQQAPQAQSMKDMQVNQIEMVAMREALLQMPTGAKWEIVLPPDRAYGADPRSGFPPNVAVAFEVKLIAVK
ncbi:MAG: FKBP-type peptidyl-prolyl cis-trans isomerase N-terminal domain-containing protein [Pseudoxanthomonas suwonensis]|nr:FKBP-type peptidyl-prolyl cis-trans isomerase N-terminal domain-containing protein [Pseudoxanthomonas suwonensis]